MTHNSLPELSSSGMDGWSILPTSSLNTHSETVEETKQGRLGAITVTPVKVDEGKVGLMERIKVQWDRLAYFIQKGYHSLIGISQNYVLQHRHSKVENFGGDPKSPNVRVGSEVIDFSNDIGPDLLKRKEGGLRFLQFELATMHEGFWQELHNISVLVDRESTPPRIYILDGKGQNPEEAFLTAMQPGAEVKSDKSVQDFINLLTIDSKTGEKIDAEVAYINTPLQRSMDCVIFPLVVRNQLIDQTEIKENDGTSTNAKEILETTLNKCLEDPRAFYREINTLRDQYLSIPK